MGKSVPEESAGRRAVRRKATGVALIGGAVVTIGVAGVAIERLTRPTPARPGTAPVAVAEAREAPVRPARLADESAHSGGRTSPPRPADLSGLSIPEPVRSKHRRTIRLATVPDPRSAPARRGGIPAPVVATVPDVRALVSTPADVRDRLPEPAREQLMAWEHDVAAGREVDEARIEALARSLEPARLSSPVLASLAEHIGGVSGWPASHPLCRITVRAAAGELDAIVTGDGDVTDADRAKGKASVESLRRVKAAVHQRKDWPLSELCFGLLGRWEQEGSRNAFWGEFIQAESLWEPLTKPRRGSDGGASS